MSVRNKDPKDHWRCKTVSFRVSPEESARIDMEVKTSGMLKQDFILKRVLSDEIVVRPNIRIQRNIINYLTDMTAELKRLEAVSEDSYILENLRYIIDLVDKLSPE